MLSLLLLLALPLLTAPLATPTPTLLSKVSSYLAYRSDFYASNANPTPSSEPFPTVLKGTTDNAFLTANSFKPKPITSPAFTEPFFTNQTFIDFQEMLDLGYSDLANEIVKAQVPCFELYKALNLPSPSLTAPIPEMNSGPLFLPDETTTDLGLSLGSSLEDQLVSDQFPKPPPPPPSPTQKVYPKLPPQQTPNWSPAQLDKQGRLAGRAQSWAFEQKRAAPKSNLAPHDIVLPSSTIVMTNGRQLYFQLFMLLGALGFGRGGHGLVEYAHTVYAAYITYGARLGALGMVGLGLASAGSTVVAGGSVGDGVWTALGGPWGKRAVFETEDGEAKENDDSANS